MYRRGQIRIVVGYGARALGACLFPNCPRLRGSRKSCFFYAHAQHHRLCNFLSRIVVQIVVVAKDHLIRVVVIVLGEGAL